MALSESDFNLALSIFFGIWFGIWGLLLLRYMCGRFKVVEQGTAMVIERYGAFNRRADAGLHFLWPFIERARSVTWRQSFVYLLGRSASQMVKIRQTQTARIDLREALMDFPNQAVVTRDNVLVRCARPPLPSGLRFSRRVAIAGRVFGAAVRFCICMRAGVLPRP